MARIAGVNIPLNKRVEIGLTYVYGIGRSTANESSPRPSVDPDTYVKDLTEDEVRKLRERGRRPDWSRATCAASARRTSSA